MKCKIDGCDRESMYKEKQLCQKHYFRIMRYGTHELTSTRKYRSQNPAGYQKLFEPKHPLANSDGYVYEHRFVIYNKYGTDLPNCELCGKTQEWGKTHIDHRDNDPTNNNIKNLRPLCIGCNVFREKRTYHTEKRKHSITLGNLTMTAAEWSRQEGVKVTGNTIIHRLAKGMAVYDAIHSERKTHQNNPNIKAYVPKETWKLEK